jgi:hypothetical protein
MGRHIGLSIDARCMQVTLALSVKNGVHAPSDGGDTSEHDVQ